MEYNTYDVIARIRVGEAALKRNKTDPNGVICISKLADKYSVYIVGGLMPDGNENDFCDTVEEAMDVAFNTARIIERDFREEN